MEKGHNTLNAVLSIAAAGEGAANDRIRHPVNKIKGLLLGRLLFLCPGLDNILNLFLHSGKQIETDRRRFHRRRNGGLFTRRLFILLIYLYTISASTISSA